MIINNKKLNIMYIFVIEQIFMTAYHYFLF